MSDLIDEFNAEARRLRAENERLRAALDAANTRFHEMNSPTGREIELGHEVQQLRAENERLKLYRDWYYG